VTASRRTRGGGVDRPQFGRRLLAQEPHRPIGPLLLGENAGGGADFRAQEVVPDQSAEPVEWGGESCSAGVSFAPVRRAQTRARLRRWGREARRPCLWRIRRQAHRDGNDLRHLVLHLEVASAAVPGRKRIRIWALTRTPLIGIFWIIKLVIPNFTNNTQDCRFDGAPARQRAYRA
jgi:hypothetical protein